MSFWKGVSTNRFRGVTVIRPFEDLGFIFTNGMQITVEVLNGDFYRYGLNLIPKSHCELIMR